MIRDLKTDKKAEIFKGKADFLLACSVTATCEIEGLTQAGIKGKIPLTPTLDAEFLTTGKIFSLEDIAKTDLGIPTPALLTRAVHVLSPFSKITVLDIGLHVEPKRCNVEHFEISPSPSITSNENFDAKSVFEKGLKFGREYKKSGDYVIVGESTPSGTTTAQAALCALGFEVDGLFASSFKNSPISLKEEVISNSLSKISSTMSIFEKLGNCSDQMVVFVAGFILSASQRFQVLLGGGTQMAAALLIADKLASMKQIPHDIRNIAICTTKWIAKDGASNINALLDTLNFSVKKYYADFSYEDANIPVLKLYDEGEAKEGVGAGSAIAYGYMCGLTQKQLTQKVEELMS
ncbi:MAG: nicotinate-nucleotide--dimethylbenzimidazole phosphoribosyltransferase [Campylobacterota bacterium]|nr:nicotinate-nucleotide--dimethylbenzimidazole phosphoribosyltransferase [Campylobacterota bacterium]